MAFLDAIFNPIFMPLVNWDPFLAIVILSLIVSLISTLAYKYLTDQTVLKEIREKQKDYQKKLKDLRSNPEELKKVQSEFTQMSMGTMKQSFGQSLKPMMITMIPLLLIFGWMAGHLAYEPIGPQETYSLTAFFKSGVVGEASLVIDDGTKLLSPEKQNISAGAVNWKLKSPEGKHEFVIKYDVFENTKSLIISQKQDYLEPITTYTKSDIEKSIVEHQPLKPVEKFLEKFETYAEFKIPIFNWRPEWLGLYFIFSLIFSMSLRKIFKVY